jgi:hypothetical protein
MFPNVAGSMLVEGSTSLALTPSEWHGNLILQSRYRGVPLVAQVRAGRCGLCNSW